MSFYLLDNFAKYCQKSTIDKVYSKLSMWKTWRITKTSGFLENRGMSVRQITGHSTPLESPEFLYTVFALKRFTAVLF